MKLGFHEGIRQVGASLKWPNEWWLVLWPGAGVTIPQKGINREEFCN